MTISEAALVSGYYCRQVKRLKKGVKEHGESFVIHKNRGRKPWHAVAEDTKNSIVKLKRLEKYSKANFSHFQELLEKHESKSVKSNQQFIGFLLQMVLQAPKNITGKGYTN